MQIFEFREGIDSFMSGRRTVVYFGGLVWRDTPYFIAVSKLKGVLLRITEFERVHLRDDITEMNVHCVGYDPISAFAKVWDSLGRRSFKSNPTVLKVTCIATDVTYSYAPSHRDYAMAEICRIEDERFIAEVNACANRTDPKPLRSQDRSGR